MLVIPSWMQPDADKHSAWGTVYGAVLGTPTSVAPVRDGRLSLGLESRS